jgi:hypothetical protein
VTFAIRQDAPLRIGCIVKENGPQNKVGNLTILRQYQVGVALARRQLIEKIGQLGAKRLLHNGVNSEVVQEPTFVRR